MTHSGSFFFNAAIASSLCFILGVFVRLSFASFLKKKKKKKREREREIKNKIIAGLNVYPKNCTCHWTSTALDSGWS